VITGLTPAVDRHDTRFDRIVKVDRSLFTGNNDLLSALPFERFDGCGPWPPTKTSDDRRRRPPEARWPGQPDRDDVVVELSTPMVTAIRGGFLRSSDPQLPAKDLVRLAGVSHRSPNRGGSRTASVGCPGKRILHHSHPPVRQPLRQPDALIRIVGHRARYFVASRSTVSSIR